MSAEQEILQKLNKKLVYKSCYSMRDVVLGKPDTDSEDSEGKVSLKDSYLFKTYLKKFEKHTLSNDPTGALTELANLVVEAAAPEAIGRELVNIIETNKNSVKFRLPKLAKAGKTSSSRKNPASVGERNTFKTINVDTELESSERWDRTFLEDAEYDVEARELEAISVGLKRKFSKLIIDKFEAITAANLAGGAEVSPASAGSLSYNDIVELRTKVRKENFNPTKLVVSEDGLGELLKDDKFLSSLFFGDALDKRSGLIARSMLGFDVLSSTQVSDKIAMMIDPDVVFGVPLRRDETLDTWDIPPDESAARVSMRFGIDSLRTKGVARMDWT